MSTGADQPDIFAGDRPDTPAGTHPGIPAGDHAATPAGSRLRAPAHDRPFRTVAIVGLGLIGGSLARALRVLPRPPRVIASSTSVRDLELAEQAGVIEDGATDPDAVVAAAELVVYATPLDVTLDLLAEHSGRWAPGAVVIDVASLKAPVEEAMGALGESARYVGSHPMAGGEGSGFAHSAADLFADATVWLTGKGVGGAAVESLWSAVGARPHWTSAPEHDRLMAWCSHLPQLAANAIARVLAETGHTAGDLGTGGADMVRLAGSSPDMWLPLLARSEVASPLRELARAAHEIADAVERRDLTALEKWMTSTRAWRAGAPGAPSPPAGPDPSPAAAPEPPRSPAGPASPPPAASDPPAPPLVPGEQAESLR